MAYKNEIESCLSQIAELEESFSEMKDVDVLPLSFFSENMALLNSLKKKLFELESMQLKRMSEHLKISETRLNENETNDSVNPVQTVEQQQGVLGDVIVRKIYADLNRSLTLNQRFMFRRDLFNDDSEMMNSALTRISSFQTLAEAIDFLDKSFHVRWDTESGAAFRELLEKRFA
ncbi:MAG: hypothetical protein LBS54_03725 [Dysgonamonadaceae bacterium]|jgi:hypothetical protein|nr:hypothetical protein [Dysgonamonadaceae bacterium]